MSINPPLVAIIMPAYHAEEYIATAIQSVLDQSHTNWQLRIVNDGSRDMTEEIILQFEDPRIVYFKQENQGVSAARNLALKDMQADFFCFLDADDALPPNSLADRLALFAQDEQLSFVDGRILIQDEQLEQTVREVQPNWKGNPLIDLVRLGGQSFFGPSWMIRCQPNKNYQLKMGMTHAEDLLFYIQLAAEGGQYAAVQTPVLRYRQGNVSAMSNLKGLEMGYWELLAEVKKLKAIPMLHIRYLKKRILRIMFLSYLRAKQFSALGPVLQRYFKA